MCPCHLELLSPVRRSYPRHFPQGGVRVNAFASGGYLPEPVRGTKQEGIVHVADWYEGWSCQGDGAPDGPSVMSCIMLALKSCSLS
jgi:hypothetical protein